MDAILLPEQIAKDILINYNGANNQILIWKSSFMSNKIKKLTRTQSEYIINYHTVEPKIARKFVPIVSSFGEKLRGELLLPKPIKEIWCEKLLCESDKAYNFWGRYFDNTDNFSFWLPKSAIVKPEKKLNRIIDFDKYDFRPVLSHQKVAIEKLLANEKFILADDMGVGKTTSAVVASIELNVKKILIICPASLKINWKREIENYSDSPIKILDNGDINDTYEYYIINYESLRNYHIIDKEKNIRFTPLIDMKFDLVIADEAHYITNTDAQRTKLCNEIINTIPRVWLLTGTPITSKPINYFNLLMLVDSPLALNWQHYVYRYCNGKKFKMGNKTIWKKDGASNLDELRESTKGSILRRMKSEVLDLPEKIITPIYLDIDSKLYEKELEEFLKISDENKNDTNISITLSNLMKVRQIISIEKIEYTIQLIENCLLNDKKVIVFTNFTNTLDILHEKFKKNSVILDGRMSKNKRQESIDSFQNNDKIKIFFGNIIAAGVGITLTAAEVVIMNDLSFVPAHHSQVEDRAYRYGQKNNVLVYYPIFENTIELIIYNILNKKKNIIDQIMGDGEYSESFANELVTQIIQK